MSEPNPNTTPAAAAALEQAAGLLAPWATATVWPEANRLDVPLSVAHLLDAAGALADSRWGYLSAITGLDHGPEAGHLEVLYHFCAGAAVLTLRVEIPREAAVVPSVCGVIPSARLYEQELHELMGVTVDGLPDLGRLFLADDWPEGIYPLRKDAVLPGEEKP